MIQTLFAIVFLCYSFGIDAGMGENNILNVTLKLNPSTRDMINGCCSSILRIANLVCLFVTVFCVILD